jgi:hypothetical protein
LLSFFRIIIFLVLFNETWDIQLLGWKTKDIILADSWLFISHDFVRTPKDVEEAEDSFTSTISIDISSSINREVPQQQQSINLCCAGDYCFVSNGHEVVCGMTCRRWSLSTVMPLRLLESDEYGYKICASCEKQMACDEQV